MARKTYDIQDDDFRVIGSGGPGPSKKKSAWIWWLAVAAIVFAFLVILLPRSGKRGEDETNMDFFDPAPEVVEPTVKPLGIEDESNQKAYSERVDTIINDVPLSIYIPHNATPRLTVGAPDAETREAVLAFQAADIRRDNRKILGAFVLEGEPLAWGLSKKGFCAIIDGEVTVGVSENSPLFEEATEKGGYFFRQYPLVDNGTLVENEPKNKSIRKALCDRSGQIFVAVSLSDESFHDFAQALVDLGVDNAIYLVGSPYAFGWWKNHEGEVEYFGADRHRESFRNENYIIWK